jgi:hypothetical protein
MPVTAKLSKAFYDRVGEQAANEIVEWFNAVDATYRSDLKEVNELNYARFDAKLEQRVGELRVQMDARFAESDGKLGRGMAELKAELIKWMFLFWAGSVVANKLIP